jgi:xylulokinase
MLAAVGVGWFATVEEACGKFVEVADAVEPSNDGGGYAAAYERYRRLYPALAELFHSMGAVPEDDG